MISLQVKITCSHGYPIEMHAVFGLNVFVITLTFWIKSYTWHFIEVKKENITCPLTNFIFSTWPCNTRNIFVTASKSGKYIYVNIWKHVLVNLEDSDTCSHKTKFVALWSLLVFVVMSGRLLSDSKSGSEPDESESLNISWYISCSLSWLLHHKLLLLFPLHGLWSLT